MPKQTDEEICKSLRSPKAGMRNTAMTQLYQDHYVVISMHVLKNSGTEEEAADIFQDAVLVFYEKIRMNEFQLTCSIRTFLYSVAKNLWLNRIKRRSRTSYLDDNHESVDISEDVLRTIEMSERQHALVNMIHTLGKDCKEVLTRYYYDRWKMEDIAAHMGYGSEQVARNKKASCMKKLKSLLAKVPGLKNIFINN